MKEHMEDIKAIREMMEKSTKFLSLSGLAGVVAGCAALVGAAFGWWYLLRDPSLTDYSHMQEMLILMGIALTVLVISVCFGLYFCWRKARRHGQSLFNAVTLRTLYNLAIPLVTGGLFCLAFLIRGDLWVVVAGTLVFYGLALINTSKYTYSEIHQLGIVEIICGLAAAYFARYGVLFWALGFGVCHIVYGIVMYRKYDMRRA